MADKDMTYMDEYYDDYDNKQYDNKKDKNSTASYVSSSCGILFLVTLVLLLVWNKICALNVLDFILS